MASTTASQDPQDPPTPFAYTIRPATLKVTCNLVLEKFVAPPLILPLTQTYVI